MRTFLLTVVSKGGHTYRDLSSLKRDSLKILPGPMQKSLPAKQSN